MLQAGVTMIVALLAMLQFGAPVDDALNTYSIVDGEARCGIDGRDAPGARASRRRSRSSRASPTSRCWFRSCCCRSVSVKGIAGRVSRR